MKSFVIEQANKNFVLNNLQYSPCCAKVCGTYLNKFILANITCTDEDIFQPYSVLTWLGLPPFLLNWIIRKGCLRQKEQ